MRLRKVGNIMDNYLYELILESGEDEDMIEAFWNEDILDDDYFQEGANMESRKIYKGRMKFYKEILKSAKTHLKNKEFKDAKKDIKNAINVLEKAKKDIEELPDSDSVSSAVFGFFTYFVVFFGEHLVVFLIPIVGYFASLGIGLKILIEQVQKIIKDIKKDKFSADSINMYRTRLISALNGYIKYTKQFMIKIDEAEKAEKEALGTLKKAKAVKESSAILAAYDACNQNLITEEEREDIINSIKLSDKASDIIEESTDTDDYENMILSEKFDEVKRLAYVKCANGEFNEETRDDIIKCAYNKFFNEEVSANADVLKKSNNTEDPQTKKDLDEMNKNIDKEMKESADELYQETFSNPIRKYLKKIEKIKDEKPGSSATPDEVKKFVDDSYDDVVEASKILEKEPSKLTKADILDLCNFVLGYAGLCGGVVLAVESSIALGIFTAALGVIAMFIMPIITWVRRNNDVTVTKNLTKIKTSLEKLENNKKLPADVKSKISKMIEKISDAETDIYAKIKNVKESSEDMEDDQK